MDAEAGGAGDGGCLKHKTQRQTKHRIWVDRFFFLFNFPLLTFLCGHIQSLLGGNGVMAFCLDFFFLDEYGVFLWVWDPVFFMFLFMGLFFFFFFFLRVCGLMQGLHGWLSGDITFYYCY